MDNSSEDDFEKTIKFNIFRPEEQQPQVGVGDVVLVFYAKVDDYRGEICLCTHPSRATEITVFTASEIPRPPGSAIYAAKPTKEKPRVPTHAECEYVSWLYHSCDKGILPTTTDFQMNTERSLNIKEKFSLLKNIEEGRFCDLVAQVVKQPYEDFDRFTLWISDYTEHKGFFNYVWDGDDTSGGQDGDPYGYMADKAKLGSRSWSGPYGKRSMQVSCYEPHASVIRGGVKEGDWVRLRNVQVKYGRNGNNMEGYLREDRSSFGGKKGIEVLDLYNASAADGQLKEALRRKRDYEKTVKEQKKTFAAVEGKKRKAEQEGDDTKLNAKQRRHAKRAAKNKQLVEVETKKEEMLGLNGVIKSESPEQPVFALSSVLDPVILMMGIDGEQVQMTLPFTNAKYRAHVRVVDYRPRKLHQFAAWRKVTEYDMLSDYDGGSESGSDSDDMQSMDAFAGKKAWEWRFALQLEEAGAQAAKDGPPKRLWAVVSNLEAQYLVNMKASDLRANPEELSKLEEQLFKLWGNLQELKEQETQALSQSRRRLAANQAPPDSSDDEGSKSHDANDEPRKQAATELSNKPFACCLRQYGIEVPERDPRKCNAGDGKRYERMFGLFGTKIG